MWKQAPSLVNNLITVRVFIAKLQILIPNIQLDETLFRISYFGTSFIAKLKEVKKMCNKSHGILNSSGLEIELFVSVNTERRCAGIK